MNDHPAVFSPLKGSRFSHAESQCVFLGMTKALDNSCTSSSYCCEFSVANPLIEKLVGIAPDSQIPTHETITADSRKDLPNYFFEQHVVYSNEEFNKR